MSMAGTDRCQFLELPAEIRELIYGWALKSDKPTVTFLLDYHQRDVYTEGVQPALTRVSKQVRKESLPVFYASNDFVLHTGDPKASQTRKWLRCIETRLPLLRHMSFWVRYVTLTNDRSEVTGAIELSLVRELTNGHVYWENDRWRWLTVTRQPTDVWKDASFLSHILMLKNMDEPHSFESAEGMSGLISDLRSLYTQEKMAY